MRPHTGHGDSGNGPDGSGATGALGFVGTGGDGGGPTREGGGVWSICLNDSFPVGDTGSGDSGVAAREDLEDCWCS